MTTLCSYDLNGKKLSFANWISNLSPQETPFTSMTGKESINQTLFQWQTDHLAPAGSNAQIEGAEALEGTMKTTQVKSNNTQILGKVVKVSDTANALANYGRGRELQYQMEKAGKEIKRDLEYVFLHNTNAVASEIDSAGTKQGRRTAGFRGLVAALNQIDTDTKAVVHKAIASDTVGDFTEAELFDLTYNLYLAGSRADIIMFHPKWATKFSALQEAGAADGTRLRIFEDTPKFSVYVSVLVDPLGQEYKLIPNRWMPEDQVYFFNTSDWTQMVLRAPQRTKLAKDGSYEKWMIEMEVGLRHRHPFASGILDLSKSSNADKNTAFTKVQLNYTGADGSANQTADLKTSPQTVVAKGGTELSFNVNVPKASFEAVTTGFTGGTNVLVSISHDGKEDGHWTRATDAAGVLSAEVRAAGDLKDEKYLLTSSCGPIHHGNYVVTVTSLDSKVVYARSKAVHITTK